MINKQTVILVSMMFLIGSAAAVVGQEDPDEGEMAITSDQSSASGSTSVTENGTEWSAEVSMRGDSTDNLEDVVLDPVYSENEFKRVEFEGRMVAPTPCHVIEHEVQESGENSYVLDIQTVDRDEDEMCTQVVTGISYDAGFEAQDTFELEVQHNGETVETLQYPGNTPREGFYRRFVNWLTGLF